MHYVFVRRGGGEGGGDGWRFGDGRGEGGGVRRRHGGGGERYGGGGGFGGEPTRGAGEVAGGPQDDERQTGDDKKPGEDANECFPGFLLSPVGSERALRFLLCHDLFPFDLHRRGNN